MVRLPHYMIIDGLSPAAVLRPESIDELSQALAAENGAIVPLGANTQTHFGNPLRRADCAVDLTALQRITEYNPADLTIHVEAGVTLEQLQHALLENNQFLPLDPWNGPSATIGGIAATNAQGPYRATGTIRDWIIGMKVVHVDGRVSKTGGRVVKNVTGYDLAKLYTGSLGTLAIIAEISLKLRSRFGKTATAIARCENPASAAAVVAAIRNSPLNPVSCEWVGLREDNAVWVRFGEHPRAVDWQLKNLPAADWKILEDRDEAAAWERLRKQYLDLGPAMLRVIGLPSAVSDIINDYGAKASQAWIAHVLNGVVLMPMSSVDEIRAIRQRYRCVIEKAPLEMRREVGTFAPDAAERDLMMKMKEAFDPEGRLNPGRHVDGERSN
jgi:glycolate oxidase FAD binding subunit